MKKLAFTLLVALTMPSAFPATNGAAPSTSTLTVPPTPAPVRRDPFWPVGYKPRGSAPVAVAPKAVAKELSDEEMQALIRREQDRIKELVAVNGKIVRGNKWYVFINQNLLVTEGHVLEVDVDGVMYSLVIKALSENNIQLEPYRQNKAKTPK